MPLIKSASNKARGKNIAAEIRAGKSPKQAAAIAYSVQREAKSKSSGKTKHTKHDKSGANHSRHLEELGSAYESNSVSSGRKPMYHPTVMASRATGKKETK